MLSNIKKKKKEFAGKILMEFTWINSKDLEYLTRIQKKWSEHS